VEFRVRSKTRGEGGEGDKGGVSGRLGSAATERERELDHERERDGVGEKSRGTWCVRAREGDLLPEVELGVVRRARLEREVLEHARAGSVVERLADRRLQREHVEKREVDLDEEPEVDRALAAESERTGDREREREKSRRRVLERDREVDGEDELLRGMLITIHN